MKIIRKKHAVEESLLEKKANQLICVEIPRILRVLEGYRQLY